MLNIGMSELFVFGIIALLVLGPDKLPEAARFAGKWYAKIKRMISNVQNDIDRELRLSELREQMQQEMQRITELEQKMQAQIAELEQQKNISLEAETSTQLQKTIQHPHYHYLTTTRSSVYITQHVTFTDPIPQIDPTLSIPELKVAV
ncbi:preprotein translocase subunit TatB [Acinetobacter sp. NRRL B-65365]|uniref:Sec-independent protein translocase protein TatB n=1 Tax=Acinetobacter sp. NRRL B-65365 TaxID=1785092 RepID=UPI0007A0694B|nr:Sec-independent protein translocase protein TatB [Acinetobacter sp. NRRL B-65365]KYQ82776.1 preprotein translocase subunit TatB [Acinetobacter sp. NRRL B-65365]